MVLSPTLSLLQSKPSGGLQPVTNGTSSFPSSGLLAFWALDGVSDSSGNSNALSNGTGVTFSAGHIGDAANINGSAILSISTLSVPLETAATVSAWFYIEEMPQVLALIVAHNTGFGIGFRQNGVLTIFDYTGVERETSATVTSDGWRHIAVTTSGSSADVYYNGSNVAQTDNIFSDIPGITIGDATYGWQGQADAVGVWNRALTATEIATLYNGGSGREL